MTAAEAVLVSRMRNKIGDNPTIAVVNAITGAVHTNGIVTVSVQSAHQLPDGTRLNIKGVLGMADLNNSFDIFNCASTNFDIALSTIQTYTAGGTYSVQDVTKQIWNDEEILEALNSGCIQLWKGNKTLTDLDAYLIEFVLIRTKADLLYQLSVDSARYSRYILKDVNAQKVDPSEFTKIADALEKRLEKMFEELDDADSGSVVTQSFFRVEDREEDIMIPTEMEPNVIVPMFTLSSVATGVQINIQYSFVPSYKCHFLKRIPVAGGAENIVEEWYRIRTESIIDTDAVSGQSYRYVLYVETLNGEYFTREATIAYATP